MTTIYYGFCYIKEIFKCLKTLLILAAKLTVEINLYTYALFNMNSLGAPWLTQFILTKTFSLSESPPCHDVLLSEYLSKNLYLHHFKCHDDARKNYCCPSPHMVRLPSVSILRLSWGEAGFTLTGALWWINSNNGPNFTIRSILHPPSITLLDCSTENI